MFEAGEAVAGQGDRLAAARERAAALAAGTRWTPQGVFLGAVSFAADTLSRAAVEPEWSAEGVDRLVRAVAKAGRVDEVTARAEIGSRALRDPHLHELPPALALEAELRLLHELARASAVGLWVETGSGEVRPLSQAGDESEDADLRAAAEGVLAEPSAGHAGAAVVAVPVLRWQRPAAALVLRIKGGRGLVARALAEEAASALAVVLERDALLTRGSERERSLVESGERRLARVAFDVHDGAIQEVVALAADLRLLRSQFAELIPGERARAIASGRVDDAHARLGALETELREVTQTLAPSSIARRPLGQALGDQLSAVRERHGIRTTLDVVGDVSALSASQRVALVRIVQEATTNAREHGGATEVHVSVRSERDGVHAEIRDNGSGFDVEPTFVDAARRGRLGLVGMSERVRLLGGRFHIDSRRGGPTLVTASFPPWKPLAEVDAAEDTHAGAVSTDGAGRPSRLLASA